MKKIDVLLFIVCEGNCQGFTEYLVDNSTPCYASHFIHLCVSGNHQLSFPEPTEKAQCEQ